MLSGRVVHSPSKSRPKLKSPYGCESLRECVHAMYSVEPGRYSQRKTTLPRSERKLKSGLDTVNAAAGPPPSGSIAYDVTTPPAPTVGVIVPRSLP